MRCGGVLGRCSSDRVSSSALKADACSMCRSLRLLAATISASKCRAVTCPLAQSVERIHGKENLGLFSSSVDQQEQPLVQVNADIAFGSSSSDWQ
jgi:hypothetical protein